MLIKRGEALALQKVFKDLKEKKFNINLQYKIIKLQKAIQAEEEIYTEQMEINCSQFFEKDEQGNTIVNEQGGVKIKPGFQQQCQQTLLALNNYKVQLPDILFTLDELEELDLSYGDLALFEPFIR